MSFFGDFELSINNILFPAIPAKAFNKIFFQILWSAFLPQFHPLPVSRLSGCYFYPISVILFLEMHFWLKNSAYSFVVKYCVNLFLKSR